MTKVIAIVIPTELHNEMDENALDILDRAVNLHTLHKAKLYKYEGMVQYGFVDYYMIPKYVNEKKSIFEKFSEIIERFDPDDMCTLDTLHLYHYRDDLWIGVYRGNGNMIVHGYVADYGHLNSR